MDRLNSVKCLAGLTCFALLIHVSQAHKAHNTRKEGHHTRKDYLHPTPEDYLAPHNAARAEVGVGPMTWNDTVAAFARDYANKRAGDCAPIHSDGPYGENIAWCSGPLTAGEAVQLWLDEKKFYDYESNSCKGGDCLHYTQVVWRDSIHLGCASVNCTNGGTWVFCCYDIWGDIVGLRPY